MNYLIKEISSAERRHILKNFPLMKNVEETFYHNRKTSNEQRDLHNCGLFYIDFNFLHVCMQKI